RAAGERPVAVSADALQVYRGLERVTGVPTAAEQARLEHRLVSILPVDARFSVGEYAELAHAAPWAAEGIDPRDRSRVVRALELLELGELEPPRGPNRLWTEDTR